MRDCITVTASLKPQNSNPLNNAVSSLPVVSSFFGSSKADASKTDKPKPVIDSELLPVALNQ
jgi:hypothetical protein